MSAKPTAAQRRALDEAGKHDIRRMQTITAPMFGPGVVRVSFQWEFGVAESTASACLARGWLREEDDPHRLVLTEIGLEAATTGAST